MDGWIKLHRKIWDSPTVTRDSDYLAVWIYLITHATHKEYKTYFNGSKIVVKPGQLITGRKKIAAITRVSESKIFRILKCFENEQQIEQQTKPSGSVISIVNWDKYQINEQPNEQQMNNERTTNEQPMNTIQELKELKEQKEEQETYTDNINSMNRKAQERLKAYRERIKGGKE